MKKADEIKKILDENSNYRDMLFCRGYLITSKKCANLDNYPFYNQWKEEECGKLNNKKIIAYYHKKQDFSFYEEDGMSIFIIGHAYNPFDMKYNENEILNDCLKAYKINEETFFEKVSELTGIHLIVLNDNERLIVVQDCSGMKSCYFGTINGEIFISSHPQLIADLCNLETDDFVEKLVKSRCYNIGNRHLPGNISPFKELKRLGGNTYAEYKNNFRIKRFYPIVPHDEINTRKQFDIGIEKIVDIIHRNVELATKKWNKPAISLSGGMDSKTTLACANGLYDKFRYFSFHCKPQEVIDANAAHKICEKLGLSHNIYSIPDSNCEIADFDILKKIIDHNTAYFMNLSDHEIRKMIYLYQLDEFDVELKSWASETARVFLERKYDVKLPTILNERHFSIFQTRYFMEPALLKHSDQLYRFFMKETNLEKPILNFEHSDLFYWEVRMGAWGTAVVSSLDFCHKVTMPINNRKLIELFLTFSHDERKNDIVHESVIKKANKDIFDMHLDVENQYFCFYRIWIEKIYYYYRTIFYKSSTH